MQFARRTALIAVIATLALSPRAFAQQKATGVAQINRAEIGPQIGYGSNSVKFFIGAQFAYPIVNRLDIYPSFQYYFPGQGLHIWSLGGNLRYWPKLNIANSGLYFGGGVDVTHSSVSGFDASATNVGLGLLSGWQFYTKSKVFPFAQVRVVLGNADRVEFGGGLNFRL